MFLSQHQHFAETLTRYFSMTKGDIEAAIAAVESLSLVETLNSTQIADEYGVGRSTLSRRARGVTRAQNVRYSDDRLLNPQQSSELLEYINGLCKRDLPPSRQMIRNFATEIVGKIPGKKWVDRWIGYNNSKLATRWTSGIDAARKGADSAFKYNLYFELLRKKIEQYDIQPEHMYNMAEKGFMIGVLVKMKRVFSKKLYDEGKLRAMLQDGNREWITTIACICGDGSALTPALIYQATTGNIQDSWLQDFDPAQHQCFFTSSPSGWTNHELGLQWLKQVFDRETKGKGRRPWRLLILDGHGSHITMEFIKYCDDNKILLAVYPPHLTHTLQPLDVVMFKPLSAAYTSELTAFMIACQGLTSITKRDFFRLFWRAWSISFKPQTVKKAFEATGLSPFNPEVILKRFKVDDSSRPSSAGSSTSVLSASDWRKIQALLKQAVADITNERSQQLSQTIHHISIQRQLLQHENTQLKEALANEKKRHKRGKPLLLEAPAEYNGGAVCGSPDEVAKAREREAKKQAEDEALQHQKAEETKRKEQDKIHEAQEVVRRKKIRANAKEARLVEQQKKALKKEEDQVEKQLQKQLHNDIQFSQIGKRKSKAAAKEAAASVVVVEEHPDEEAAPSAVIRRGRKFNLPKHCT